MLSLIMLLPIAGMTGLFPQPTPDLYNTQKAYEFILMLMDTKYIMYLDTLVFTVALVLLWTRREALAAVLVFPITVNVVAFHAFIDGGLLTGGALMGNVMLAANLYLFWVHQEQYAGMLKKRV